MRDMVVLNVVSCLGVLYFYVIQCIGGYSFEGQPVHIGQTIDCCLHFLYDHSSQQ